MNGLFEATTLCVEQMNHMENAFVLKPHKWLRRMFILTGQCKTCANVQGRPLFQKQTNKQTNKQTKNNNKQPSHFPAMISTCSEVRVTGNTAYIYIHICTHVYIMQESTVTQNLTRI